jgi:hypothetical protein
VAPWRRRLASGLLAVAAISALGSAAGGIAHLATADPELKVLEAWRSAEPPVADAATVVTVDGALTVLLVAAPAHLRLDGLASDQGLGLTGPGCWTGNQPRHHIATAVLRPPRWAAVASRPAQGRLGPHPSHSIPNRHDPCCGQALVGRQP